ncbi:MAG: hypothetical protein ACKOX3_02755 [Bacteroidota bacterium]
MKKNILFTLMLGIIALSGCYYDNVEELHPYNTDKACGDTSLTTLTYNANVRWIIEGSCGTTGAQGSNCHGASSSQSFSLASYSDLKNCVNSPVKTLLLDIKQTPDANSPMPKGGGKLTDCQIKVVENWINQGMLEN